MSEEEGQNPGFKVVDKRGRSDEEETEASEEPRGQELPAADFSTFLLSLGTSALYHLGLVKDPESGETAEANRPLAKQTIDTLEILQQKTQGNLTEQESQLLQNLLTELRMRFVEAGK
ncbi:MAG: DUF1844 domain-containing protein [Akkermansiaceae bacterium]|nr:DUF1844 domain-containing protein [Akkermansiaceae bacterium]